MYPYLNKNKEKNDAKNINEISSRFNSLLERVRNNVEFALEEKDFFIICDYIENNLLGIFDENFHIDDSIKIFLKNPYFLEKANFYIKNNFPKLKNDSNDIYDKISLYITFLGLGKYFAFSLIDDLNGLNVQNLEKLFQEYLSIVENSVDDDKKINIYLDSFISLSELVNFICILNLGDRFKSGLIFKFKKVLYTYINEVLDNFSDKISIEKSNELLSFLSREAVNFSFTDSKIFFDEFHRGDDLSKSVERNFFLLDTILENILFGYNKLYLLKNEDKEFNLKLKNVFVGNFLYTIITFFDSFLEQKKGDNFIDEAFEKLKINNKIKIFFDELKIDISKINSFDEFKKTIENIFSKIYFDDTLNFNDNSKIGFEEVKNDFQLKNGDVSYSNIQIIRCLVLLKSKDWSLDELIDTGQIFFNTRYKNHNFEFSKLEIVLNIIQNLPKGKIDDKIYAFLISIGKYLEENRKNINLLYIYGKIYLSLSLYLSYFSDKKNIVRSLDYYSLFLRVIPKNWDSHFFKKEIEEYTYNIGRYFLNLFILSKHGKNNFSYKEEILKGFSKEFIISFGNEYLKNFLHVNELKLEKKLNRKLNYILEEFLEKNDFDEGKFNLEVGKVITDNLFNNVATVFLYNNNTLNQIINDNRHILFAKRKLEIDLNGDYKMLFIYSKIYEEVFNKIFSKEKTNLFNIVKSVINTSSKKRKMYFDHNTGLPNELKLKLDSIYFDKNFYFLLIKITIFKNISNGYGVEIGREFMSKIASIIKKENKIKGFYSVFSDYFGIFVENDNDVEYILNILEKAKINISGIDFKLNHVVSIVKNDNEDLIEKRLRAIQFREEKEINVFYGDNEDLDYNQNKEELLLLKKLDNAIEDDRIVPFFQPIFDSKSLKPYKYEVLMRVLNENGIYESPFKHLKVAEEFLKTNLISGIIIDKVFKFLSINGGNYSINLSINDILNENFMSFIDKKVIEYGINPNNITFEVLEKSGLQEQKLIENILKFRQKGFKIAIDDFGREASNFDRLLEFIKNKYTDYLKIDGNIIQNLQYSKDYEQAEITFKMLKGIVDGAHAAKIKVVAEYVDNEEIFNVCRILGIDLLQGFYLGKPEKDILK